MAYNFTFYNNYESVTVTAPLAVGASSLTVLDASPLVSPAAGRVLRATLQSPTDKTLYEIINITVVAGNVLAARGPPIGSGLRAPRYAATCWALVLVLVFSPESFCFAGFIFLRRGY